MRCAACSDVADIAAAAEAGQVGVIYGFQNTEMLGGELERVRLFAKMGVRVIQLTYNGRNAVGDGATVPDDQGLSRFGAEVVERVQSEGMLLDLSHSSEKTCLDALSLAQRPAGDHALGVPRGGRPSAQQVATPSCACWPTAAA